MLTVAVISPKRSLEPINRVIETRDFGCEFHRYVYNELEEIKTIYEQCKNNCDVIFFSGELGYHYMLNHIPEVEVPCSFTAYGTKDILSILLRFVIEHPEIPLNRVHVDFLTPLNNFMNIDSYLPKEYLPYFHEDCSEYDYEHITARVMELWEAGKIDMVLTRSTNNLKTFDRLGVPYIAIFPTEQMIAESMEHAITTLKVQNQQECECITAIVRLILETGCSAEEREYRMASLHKILVDVRKNKGLSFVITEGYDRFEIKLNVPAASDCSEIFQSLLGAVQQRGRFEFRCGFGIAKREDTSHYYAETALLEALRYDGNDGFLVSGENAVLTGPLTVSEHLICDYNNDNVVEFARKVGIHATNLVRLVGYFALNPDASLTSTGMGKLLNVTPRSANRIIQILLDVNLLKLAPAKNPKGKGRPGKEYLFVADNFRRMLEETAME